MFTHIYASGICCAQQNWDSLFHPFRRTPSYENNKQELRKLWKPLR